LERADDGSTGVDRTRPAASSTEFSYETARANYQTARGGGTTVNSLRFGTGPVVRIGEVTAPLNGREQGSAPP
jgi:hypothetical protein